MFKREFTFLKLYFLFILFLGIFAHVFIGKCNALSLICYFIALPGFFAPADLLRRF